MPRWFPTSLAVKTLAEQQRAMWLLHTWGMWEEAGRSAPFLVCHVRLCPLLGGEAAGGWPWSPKEIRGCLGHPDCVSECCSRGRQEVLLAPQPFVSTFSSSPFPAFHTKLHLESLQRRTPPSHLHPRNSDPSSLTCPSLLPVGAIAPNA